MRRQASQAAIRAEAVRLIARAAAERIRLDRASAEELAAHGPRDGVRELDRVLWLIRAADAAEGCTLTARRALDLLDISGGRREEALRKVANGGPELRPGVSGMLEHAASRGLDFTPRRISELFRERGTRETRCYLNDLVAVMEAAAQAGIECTQLSATRRLGDADGDVDRVLAGFRATRRRREDRRAAPCRARRPPRDRAARGNAFARCGCRRCEERLVLHMRPYMSTVVSRSSYARRHREDAYSVGYLVLLEAIDTWPAGECDFARWFAACLSNRLKRLYALSLREEERVDSLDATFLTDTLGRPISLYELVPDRSHNPLGVVLFLELLRELKSERHGACAERSEEYLAAQHAEALELLESGQAC